MCGPFLCCTWECWCWQSPGWDLHGTRHVYQPAPEDLQASPTPRLGLSGGHQLCEEQWGLLPAAGLWNAAAGHRSSAGCPEGWARETHSDKWKQAGSPGRAQQAGFGLCPAHASPGLSPSIPCFSASVLSALNWGQSPRRQQLPQADHTSSCSKTGPQGPGYPLLPPLSPGSAPPPWVTRYTSVTQP